MQTICNKQNRGVVCQFQARVTQLKISLKTIGTTVKI